jgi:ABC-type Fe3+-hydroxamate transport system substrate-binding protein
MPHSLLSLLSCLPYCSVDLRLVEKVVQDMQHNNNSSSSNGTAAAIQQAPRIISLNPFNIEDVLQDALVVGEALGLQNEAEAAVAALRGRVDAALSFVARQPPLAVPVVAFLEWFEPLFPGGHWTPQLIHMAGGDCGVERALQHCYRKRTKALERFESAANA